MSEQLKVTQATKVSGNVDAGKYQAQVAGKSGGDQAAGGSCPDCGGNHSKAGKNQKAG